MYDYVYIAYNGKVDGMTMMDDGAVSDGYYLLLGSDGFIEGFEDGIVGMKVGDKRDVPVKLPADYIAIQYAGKDAVFTVELKEIIRMPEITDAIAQKHSVYSNKEEFMTALREHCLFDYEWQMLMSKCTLKGYPNKEYTEYYQYFIGYFYDLAEAENMTIADFLKEKGGYYRSYGLWRGMTEAQLRDVATSYAKSNLINDLLTYSIMRLENIKTEGAEWDAAVAVLEREYGMTYAKIVKDSGQTAAIISVLNIRISNVLTGYATVVD
jgi:trigger factor